VSRWEAWLVHAATFAVWATGAAYLWMRYLAEPSDPDALENHPWQSETQHAHVLAAPLLVFACGLIWSRHVWARWTTGQPERRRSGVVLALGLAPMVASGYLLQTAVDERWRRAWVVVHVGSSIAWAAAYACHLFAPRPDESDEQGRRSAQIPAPKADRPESAGRGAAFGDAGAGAGGPLIGGVGSSNTPEPKLEEAGAGWGLTRTTAGPPAGAA
jgi:hypothetical protein